LLLSEIADLPDGADCCSSGLYMRAAVRRSPVRSIGISPGAPAGAAGDMDPK